MSFMVNKHMTMVKEEDDHSDNEMCIQTLPTKKHHCLIYEADTLPAVRPTFHEHMTMVKDLVDKLYAPRTYPEDIPGRS